MTRSLARVGALMAILYAASGGPAAAAAAPAQETLTLYVPLYQALVGVQGATQAPTVRLLEADRSLVFEVVAGSKNDAGIWLAELSFPSALTGRTLIRPGQIVEATSGSSTVSVEVPELTISTDADSDTVTGQAPGMQALRVQLHWDTVLFGDVPEPEAETVAVDSDGGFVHSWAGRTDLEPGMWGEAYGLLNGHVFTTQFAPPQATVYWDQPVIQVRADPGGALEVVSESIIDGRTFRSTAYPYAGSLHYVPLYDPEDPAAPPERLRARDFFRLERDGVALFNEELPRITAEVDRPFKRATGSGPPDARVRARVQIGDAQAPFSQAITVGPDGSWQLELGAEELPRLPRVEAIFYGKGALAHHVTGAALRVAADLYGFRMAGVIRGRDEVRVRLRGDGTSADARAETAFDGSFRAELYDHTGEPAIVRPDMNLSVEPRWGPAVQHTVPRVTAKVTDGRKVIAGVAPPGSIVTGYVYSTAPSIFLGQPYERPFVTLETRADDSGNYRLVCTSECMAEYGLLFNDDGTNQAQLRWLSKPVAEADVLIGSVRGLATAGDQVRVRAGAESWEGVSVPSLGEDLPGWRAELGDAFAGGFEVGTPLALSVGTSAMTATVPALTWSADTTRDRVTGTGPPNKVVIVAAFPPAGDATRQPAVSSVPVSLAGTWAVNFPGFDLRGGDALELLVQYGDLVLRWYEPAVHGNDPATPTPVARESWFSFLPILHDR